MHSPHFPSQKQKQGKNSQKGVALIMVIVSLLFITYIALEVTYETNVEYIVQSRKLNELKAYYAAKAGLKIGLLRSHVYQQIQEKIPPEFQNSLRQFIDFPFRWPPTDLLALASKVDQSLFQQSLKDSIFDGTYDSFIENEGDKIDISNLGSPSQILSQLAYQQLNTLLKNALENEKSNQEQTPYRWKALKNTDIPFIINNIVDWQDPNTRSLNGGPESLQYSNLSFDEDTVFPPNRVLRSLSELHMIAGIKDILYEIIEPHITLYGNKFINPNGISKEILMALHEALNEQERIDFLLKAKEEFPFDAQNFFELLGEVGLDEESVKEIKDLPLQFNASYNFRVIGTSQVGDIIKTITVITQNTAKIEEQLFKIMELEIKRIEKKKGKQTSTSRKKSPKRVRKKASSRGSNPNKSPQIVHWEEN